MSKSAPKPKARQDSRDDPGAQICTTLAKLALGHSGQITNVHTRNVRLHRKLMAMGLIAGTVVEVVGIAPLGDPIQIRALSYVLSLRKSEAETIEINILS